MKNLPESTYKLIKKIVDAIDATITIQSVITIKAKDFTLNICDTLWATQGFDVTIQGNVYSIVSVVPNVSITVTTLGTSVPVPGDFTLYLPKFYNGTIKSTVQDLAVKTNNRIWISDKLPMIWLHETVDEDISLDSGDAIVMTSSVDLYFMIDNNFAKWTNNDHHVYAIDPMRQLYDSFISSMDVTGIANTAIMDNPKVNDFANWGTTMEKDGSSKQIFQYQMSGIKASMQIPFIRSNKTCCKQNLFPIFQVPLLADSSKNLLID